MRYEKATIHKVCCLFHNFFWAEIFCPKSQKVVFRGCLKYDEELIEYVIDNYGHYPPDYEKWLFVYFHITTSANRCASFEKNGIHHMKHTN